MKKILILLSLLLLVSASFSQKPKGRKRRINRKEGGFIPCTFVCTLHSRNCLYFSGYHEITAKRRVDNKEFCTYKGGFLAGRFSGYGEYHNADGSLDYVGTFRNGFFKKGKLTNKYGDTLIGEFKKDDKKWYLNNGYISSKNWFTLEDSPDNLQRSDQGDRLFVRGHVKEGKLNGKVYFKVLTGDYAGTEFNGEFYEGKIKGCGIMKIFRSDDFLDPANTKTNDCYINFKSTNPSGDIYIGQWDSCGYNGWGVLTSKQYATSYGYWNDDKVTTDIPYSLVTSTIEDLCHFNYDWETAKPKIKENVFNELPDLDMGASFVHEIKYDTVYDNRGNYVSGIDVKVNINYDKKNIVTSIRGDYPPGSYDLYSSLNSVKLLKALDSAIIELKKDFNEKNFYDLIDTSTEVTFKITATTDRSKIRRAIKYKWEKYNLDSTYSETVWTTDELNYYTLPKKININKEIKYNSQLSFLRAIGIKKYLTDSLSLDTKNIIYKIQIDTANRNRTIGIEMFINNERNNQNPKIKYNKKVTNSAPKNTVKDSNTAAIIIYFTKYREPLSTGGLVYAESDAKLMKEYFIKTLGIDTANIKIISNEFATIADINFLFNSTIPKMAKNGIKNVIIYYQGHGFADKNKSIYILPYDIRISNNRIISKDIDSLAGYINKSSKIIRDSLNSEINFFTIFDACASYSEFKHAWRDTADYNSTNSCLISASKMFSVARLDKTLKHSLLTYGFCYALFDFKNTDYNSDDVLTFDEIYQATKKFVVEQTKQHSLDESEIQTPSKYGKGNWQIKILDLKNITQ